MKAKRLVFKSYVVTPNEDNGNCISIGCIGHKYFTFSKDEVKAFWQIAFKAQSKGVKLKELYIWIDDHAKELGLIDDNEKKIEI
jgi:hypothetical protein